MSRRIIAAVLIVCMVGNASLVGCAIGGLGLELGLVLGQFFASIALQEVFDAFRQGVGGETSTNDSSGGGGSAVIDD